MDQWKNSRLLYVTLWCPQRGCFASNLTAGTITWKNKNYYKGLCVKGKMHGYGEYTWPDGSQYKGEFSNQNRHGNARVTFNHGVVFEGLYANDKKEGKGKLIFPDGDIFEGMWRNGARFGAGVLRQADTGLVIHQIWNEDQKSKYSKGVQKFP